MHDNEKVVNGFSSKLCINLQNYAHMFNGKGAKKIAKVIQVVNRLLTGADIDREADVSPRVIIPHTVGIVIGQTAKVEEGVVLMPHVTLGASSHHSTEFRRHPWIKKNAYIGAGAVLLGSIVIGKSAVVGANAVVVRDVPTGVTVVGIPAQRIDK